MLTSLTPTQVKQVRGKCSGCFHASSGDKSSPGASSVCVICARNPRADRDCAATADDGKVAYGPRDCFIARDRFEMELRGETFLKGVSSGG